MEDASQQRGIHGVDAVIDFLERHQAAYEVIEHRDTFAATSEARAAGTPPERMAKTVLLHDHDGSRQASAVSRGRWRSDCAVAFIASLPMPRHRRDHHIPHRTDRVRHLVPATPRAARLSPWWRVGSWTTQRSCQQLRAQLSATQAADASG